MAEDRVACALCKTPDDGQYGWVLVTIRPPAHRRVSTLLQLLESEVFLERTLMVCPTCLHTIIARLRDIHGRPMAGAVHLGDDDDD
jgi:hypothetical protein